MPSKSITTPTQKTLAQSTLIRLGNLVKLLPTGTVFMFQFLNPVLTNNGHCHAINKYSSIILIILCGLSCCFASFTDSYTDAEGHTHCGIATTKGLWPYNSSSSMQDLSVYKIHVGDFVHAFFLFVLFAVVSLLDPNTVRCLYPAFGDAQKVLLMAMPPILGVVSGFIFVVFPNYRHGIGYPSSRLMLRSTSTSAQGCLGN